MKLFIRLIGLLTLLGLLIACGGAPPAQETAPPEETAAEEVPTRVVEVEATVAPVEETVVEETVVEETVAEEEMAVEDAAAEAVMAVDGPTHQPAETVEEALEERSYDQIKGGEDPLLTVIEYGDFQ